MGLNRQQRLALRYVAERSLEDNREHIALQRLALGTVHALERRGLVVRDLGLLALTGAGRAAYEALPSATRVSGRPKPTRRRVLSGWQCGDCRTVQRLPGSCDCGALTVTGQGCHARQGSKPRPIYRDVVA